MSESYNTCKSEAEVVEPTFLTIITRLREELSHLNENANIIRSKTYMLQDFTSPDKCSNEDQPQRVGVIGELYDCLDEFRKYNIVLDDVRNGLITLLG